MTKKEIEAKIQVNHTYKSYMDIVDFNIYPPIHRHITFYRTVFDITDNLVCIGHPEGDNLEWMTKNKFLEQYEEV